MKLNDFLAASGNTRMAQKTKDVARLVLVDGMRVVDAARQMEMKRQQVEEAVARIEASYKKLQGIPENWVCVTVSVPPELANTIYEMEKTALRDNNLLVD